MKHLMSRWSTIDYKLFNKVCGLKSEILKFSLCTTPKILCQLLLVLPYIQESL